MKRILFVFLGVLSLSVLAFAPPDLRLAIAVIELSLTWAALALGFPGRGPRRSDLPDERDAELSKLREELARGDQLASFAMVAVGAAHEMGTPLATIGVVSKELETYATRCLIDPQVAEDSRLIRAEVERCRSILQGMRPGSGHGIEKTRVVSASELLAELPDVGRRFSPSTLHIDVDAGLESLVLPREAVAQALSTLVKNAFEASYPGATVRVRAARREASLQFIVLDEGEGMDRECLRRVTEPFFSTKEPGQGMGLGTFLARLLAERLGGRLIFESTRGRGTKVTLELPLRLERPLVHARA